MNITLNGEPHQLEPGCTLAEFFQNMNLEPNAFASALNGQFVARGARAACVLQENDAVFTFQAIVGG